MIRFSALKAARASFSRPKALAVLSLRSETNSSARAPDPAILRSSTTSA